MTRKFVVGVALCGAWLGWMAGVGRAQDPILTELYGTGVHDYFGGSYRQAITDLTEAVDGNTKDPRVYYFRALAWLRLGDSAKAQSDFAAGAKLESADINGYYPVSKSLERVQGSGRLTLEKYRVQARAEAYRRQEKRNLARYEAQRRAEAEVLRATPPPPTPGDMTAPAAGSAPATGPTEKPADQPAAKPAAEQPADDADPFADDNEKSADAMPDKDASKADEPAEADADAASPDDEMPADDSMEDDSDKK